MGEGAIICSQGGGGDCTAVVALGKGREGGGDCLLSHETFATVGYCQHLNYIFVN